MVAFTINMGEYSPYKFREKTGYIFLDSNSQEKHFYSGSVVEEMPQVDISLRTLDLTSDGKKILASTPRSFYHFIIDLVGKLNYQLEKDRDVEVILDRAVFYSDTEHPVPGYPIVYQSLLEGLDNLNIKYSFVDFNKYDVIKINNFYTLAEYQPEINYAKSAASFYSFYVKDKAIKPHRKIFISRRLIGNRVQPNLPSWIKVNHDNRIDNYLEIEEYFSSLGFEIVFAESIRSFREQVSLFYEAEIVVGTSGSGLTNAVFMQNNTTVVELFTPLIINIPENILRGGPGTIGQMNPMNNPEAYVPVEEIHFFYSLIALHKQQKYISIQNFDRSVANIKEVIESDSYMRSLFHREESDPGIIGRLLKR